MGNRRKSVQMPRVGIFWFVKSQLVTSVVTLDKAEVCDGRYDINENHHSFWEQWKNSHHPNYDGLSYDYFPRGRVIYCSDTDEYNVYADRCLLANRRFEGMIRRTFSLPGRKCNFNSDLHYRCHQCNKMFLSD